MISQLIIEISGVLLKLLEYINGNIILTYILPSFPILPAISALNVFEALLLLSTGKWAIAPLASENGLFL